MNSKEILSIYNKNIRIYDNFKNKIEILLKELLQDNINYHHITSRIKTKDSLEKKLISKENKYSKINEITDIVVCRIISYFEDDVDEHLLKLRKQIKNYDLNQTLSK